MHTAHTKPQPNGTCRVVVYLLPGERLIAIRDGAHYKLGNPVDDIIASHILTDAREVVWCSASQAWVS